MAPQSRSSRWRPASAIGLDAEHIEPERVRVLDGEHA